MNFSALVVILTINSFCAFSEIPHEILYLVGCFENGTTEVQFEFDAEEFAYVDFDRHELVYTVPRIIVNDPSKTLEDLNVLSCANKNKHVCAVLNALVKTLENNPPEETDPPESVLYPSDDVQLGVENLLICFVNHFYPPDINVSWTRNGRPVSEGVSLSRYYPNNDQTFHQFSTLTFTPSEGDIYSCSVEHLALDSPKTRIWEADFTHRSLGPDVYCGVGLTLGIMGVTAGTFLMVKGHQGQ